MTADAIATGGGIATGARRVRCRRRCDDQHMTPPTRGAVVGSNKLGSCFIDIISASAAGVRSSVRRRLSRRPADGGGALLWRSARQTS